jgi:tetratricopeptide (TPR) repeat protein
MALGGLLLLVAGLCLGPVEETDLFFRMAAGEQFLRTGHLVHRNLFSFTYPDAPYLDSAWLFDVAVAGLHRLGGFPAVVLGKTMVVLLVAGLAYRLCRKLGAGKLLTAAVLSLAFVCMRERLVERPHVFSLLGEVALLGLLPSIVKAERQRWLVLPLVALWVNLHAGAFLAETILGFAAMGAALDRQPSWVVVRLVAFAGSATLLLVASPVGAGIFRYLTFHVGVFDLHPVDEFRNATWRSDWPFALFALGATSVLAISRRQSWLLRLPALGLVGLGLWHIRFSADATLVLAVVAAPAVESLASRFAWLGSRVAAAVFVAVLGLVTLGPRVAAASRGERFIAVDLDRRSLPEEARRFVEEHCLRDRMYNDFETGSYLLWQGYPTYRVFVDPRLPAYPAEFHRLLGRMDISRQEWTAAMEALGVNSALLDYAGINRRVSYWDPEAWALLFRAKDARVFVRRLPKWRSLIEQFEIPASFDFTVENGAVTLPLENPPAASPVPACEWQFRLGDLHFDLEGTNSAKALAAYRAALAAPSGCLAPEHELSAAAWMGSLDLAAHDFAKAIALLDRALARAPEDTTVLANRALALQGLGRATEARETWARIARLEPTSALGRKAASLAQPHGSTP